MKNISIVGLLERMSFDYKSIVSEIKRIGDVTAIRKKGSVTYRRNYERAILIVALARHYGLSDFLEFGTGRGFVCAALLSLCNMNRISTIDKQSIPEALSLIESLNLDSSTIDGIVAEANAMKPANLKHDYDLVFIDAQHDGKSVGLNYNLAKTSLKKPNIIIFDDYRNKFSSVKKKIDRMSFKHKLVVHTDGWIIKNAAISSAKDADKVVNGKEYVSGMVLCSNTLEF